MNTTLIWIATATHQVSSNTAKGFYSASFEAGKWQVSFYKFGAQSRVISLEPCATKMDVRRVCEFHNQNFQ